MDEAFETEWQWFRHAIRDSLVRPGRFAASLAREHYGLAGVLVAILAGIGLSISIDALVLADKGLSVLDYTGRIVLDALFLGVRLAIVAALVSGAVALFMRVARHADVSMDQAFTAVTFALTPLAAAPVLAAALAIVPGSLPIIGVLAVLLVARLLYGLFVNLRPLAPLVLVIAAVAIVLASVPLTLPDQVSRIEFTALAYQPELAPQISATPTVGGTAVTGDGFALILPARWKEVHLGISGEIARYQTDTDVLVVARAAGGALATPDTYAENVALAWRRGLDRTSSSRSIERSGDLLLVDDTYQGTVDGRPELLRQFTTVVGTQGMALLFRYIEPADPATAMSESTAIASSWRVPAP
jgi:hypothetical protein